MSLNANKWIKSYIGRTEEALFLKIDARFSAYRDSLKRVRGGKSRKVPHSQITFIV